MTEDQNIQPTKVIDISQSKVSIVIYVCTIISAILYSVGVMRTLREMEMNILAAIERNSSDVRVINVELINLRERVNDNSLSIRDKVSNKEFLELKRELRQHTKKDG